MIKKVLQLWFAFVLLVVGQVSFGRAEQLNTACVSISKSVLVGDALANQALECIEQLSKERPVSSAPSLSGSQTTIVPTSALGVGWSAYPGYLPFQYTRLPDGTVQLQGMMSGCPDVNNPIFVLPKELAPSNRLMFAATANDAAARLDVDPNGLVIFMSAIAHTSDQCNAKLPLGRYLSISGVQFLPAQ